MKVTYEDDTKKVAYFNGYRFVRDDKTNFFLSSIKIGDRRPRLHVYVWEYFNGPVPEGFHIHHLDRDHLNNDIENLRCVEKGNHLSYHAKKNFEEHPEKFMKNLESAREAAKEWHGSEAGREWHKKHYDEMGAALHVERVYTCQICGKVFKSTRYSCKFCCNAHRATARRRSGVDNITATCVVCGKPFAKNKYSKITTCSRECGRVKRWHGIMTA